MCSLTNFIAQYKKIAKVTACAILYPLHPNSMLRHHKSAPIYRIELSGNYSLQFKVMTHRYSMTHYRSKAFVVLKIFYTGLLAMSVLLVCLPALMLKNSLHPKAKRKYSDAINFSADDQIVLGPQKSNTNCFKSICVNDTQMAEWLTWMSLNLQQ